MSRTRANRRWTLAAATVALAVIAGACSDKAQAGDNTATGADKGALVAPALPADAVAASFVTSPSVGMVTVQGTKAGTPVALYAGTTAVATGTTDKQGAFIFRKVKPGEYKVATTGGTPQASDEVKVPTKAGSLPPQSFYTNQKLSPGYGYITTRDGTKLAASVYLPGPVENGPYPTVVEYSGYNPAQPGGSIAKDNQAKLAELGLSTEQVCGIVAFLCNSPAQPSSSIALAEGYAVVAVNVRGTGCSGGAYDFFDEAQRLDGYDVIEAAAAQPWVKGNKVGMVGLSYPGISQLFVAETQPPHLAAITPMSVNDDTVRGVLSPGGIFNDGFAGTWGEEVLAKARPYGQGWERKLVDQGDSVCAANQTLRGQNVDIIKLAKSYRNYPKELGDSYNASKFVDRISVPVFLTGAFQDEQTGGRWSHLWGRFTHAPIVRMNLWNGAHADGYGPQDLAELKTFLDLYVANDKPSMPPIFSLLAPVLLKATFGAELTVPAPPHSEATSYEAAKAAYEAEPPVKLTFQSGAGDPKQPGAPIGTNDYRFDTWPPADVTGKALYLTADGSMSPDSPRGKSESATRYNFDAGIATTNTLNAKNTSDVFKALPKYEWKQEPKGSAAVFVSPPLTEDLVMAGPASADLWIRSSVPQADIGVTLSEVRPDGKETYIQSGVLRGSMRKPSPQATDLWADHTGYASDDSPMPVGKFTEARVEIFPFDQVVRKGSRLRISVHTPGGDRPRWTYILADGQEGATFDVGHSADTPSRLMLPVTHMITGYPAELPACPALRGQPCRAFEDYKNTEAP